MNIPLPQIQAKDLVLLQYTAQPTFGEYSSMPYTSMLLINRRGVLMALCQQGINDFEMREMLDQSGSNEPIDPCIELVLGPRDRNHWSKFALMDWFDPTPADAVCDGSQIDLVLYIGKKPTKMTWWTLAPPSQEPLQNWLERLLKRALRLQGDSWD